MEGLLFSLIVLPLAILVMAVLGVIAFAKVGTLELRIMQLERQLQRLASSSKDIQAPELERPATTPKFIETDVSEYSETPPQLSTEDNLTALSSESSHRPIKFFEHLREHWMVWLGGVCVGLAGVFMVRYSIEQQLLGPEARLVLAGLSGVMLHGVAEWLRRNKGAEPSFAALAGGASIILYASVFGAFRLLDNPSVSWVFIGMALVSFATMLLALRHGPLLAALGMLGGYLVPVLVSSGDGHIEYALSYVLILSMFSLWLMAYVKKHWLWRGVVLAGLLWWLISLDFQPNILTEIRSFYLTALLYLLVAVPVMDWRLQQRSTQTAEHWWQNLKAYWSSKEQKELWLVVAAIALAQVLSWAIEGFVSVHYLSLLALPLLFAYLALQRPEFNAVLAVLLVLTPVALFFNTPIYDSMVTAVGLRLLALAVFYVAIATLWWRRATTYSNFWLGIGCSAPLLMLAAAYYSLDFIAQDWAWCITAATLGVCYSGLATHWLPKKIAIQQVILFSAAHVAYSLAVVIGLEDASLTLALAVQLLSLTWLVRRYQLEGLKWVLRLVLAIVVIRLTLNPWLFSYGNGNTWIPWIYSGAFIFSAISAWQLRDQQTLQPWLLGGTVQLAVLMLAVLVRWWLYDGYIYQLTMSFTEASIYVSAWGALALLYQWRAQNSHYAARFYHAVALLHGGAAAVLYVGYLLLWSNPLWEKVAVHSTPIWNILLLGYGLPTILLVLFVKQIQQGAWKQTWLCSVQLVTALNAWFFISIEVRHLWHRSDSMMLWNDTSMGELYTYSAVWLLAAMFTLVAGIWRANLSVYRGGMALLLVVVAKIFLIDMAELSGLWRVASFMGLGLILLALAWLYQRYGQQLKASATTKMISE